MDSRCARITHTTAVNARLRDILPSLRATALRPCTAPRCTDEELAAGVDALNALAVLDATDPAIPTATERLYPLLRSRILSAPCIQSKAPLIEALHRYVYGRPGRRPLPGPAATLAEARARALAAYSKAPAMSAGYYMRNLLHSGPAGIRTATELLHTLAATEPADIAEAIDRLDARIAAAGLVPLTPADNEYWVALASRLLSTVKPARLTTSLLHRWHTTLQSLSTLPWRPDAPYPRHLTTLRRYLRTRATISASA